MPTKTPHRIAYAPHPALEYSQAILRNLPTTTGKTLDEWLALLAKKGPKTEEARRTWLQKEHGLGGTTAWGLAEISVGKGKEGYDEQAYLEACPGYIAAQYPPKKAHLKPIYERLLEVSAALGKDIRICPCQTMVPIYRNHVIAQIKPATLKRIDLGFALGEMKPTGRLIDTGGFTKKDRITHRIELTSLEDIQPDIEKWLKKAYDRDA